MAGASYRATFADGSVRLGTLDEDGAARLDGLPPALAGTAVEVAFGEAAAAYQALPERGEPNPAYRGSETAFDASLLRARPQLASAGGAASLTALGLTAASFAPQLPDGLEAAVDWIWGVIQGDFAEDPSNGQIVAGAVVTMIPLVDQIADVRDVVANLARLRDPAVRQDVTSPAYLMLATTAVGVVPVVGSAVKGALRLALRNPDAGRAVLFAVLRRLGRGDPEAFVRRHLTPGAIAAHAQRGLGIVQGKVHAVLAGMERVGRALGVGRLVAAAQAFRQQFAEVMAAARRGVQWAASKLGERVAAMVRRGDSDTGATGAVGGEVRAQPAATDPPSQSSGGGPDSGGPKRGDEGRGREEAGKVPRVETDKQGKHVPGHNNYIEGRSVFTHPDPQELLGKYAGTGQRISGVPGGPGKERVDFGHVIGQVRDANGTMVNTTRGIIHYSKSGAHIVPANP